MFDCCGAYLLGGKQSSVQAAKPAGRMQRAVDIGRGDDLMVIVNGVTSVLKMTVLLCVALVVLALAFALITDGMAPGNSFP